MCNLLLLLSVLLDQSCQSVTVNYQGFNIIWNYTLAGTTVEVQPEIHGKPLIERTQTMPKSSLMLLYWHEKPSVASFYAV